MAAPRPAPAERPRLAWVDALRVALIALVVSHHAVEPYASPIARWTILPGPPVPGLWSFLWVNAAFFMGLFFFLAGAFTPASYDRKGPEAFGRDRALRLGVPLAWGLFVMIPLQAWFHHRVYRALPPIGYFDYFTGYFLGLAPRPDGWPATRPFPDLELGHLWFLEHLWIYAGLYLLWRAVAREPDRSARPWHAPGHLAIALYACALAAATWAIRIRYPQDDWIGFLGFIQVEPAHWPQYASLFVLGVVAGRQGWLETLPARRGLAWLAVGLSLAVACYVVVGLDALPSWSSQSLVVCTWEAFLCTGLCVGLPVAFRQFGAGAVRLLAPLAPDVLAVYVFHFPIVMLLQWAQIGSALPVSVRILVSVLGGIALAFAFSRFVVRRIPGARRVF
jgi:hypothetical protein